MPGKSLFPAVPIQETQQIARVIAERNSGQPMRRLDVFEALGKSPDSGPSRIMVTASSGFGLTTGSYKAETLALTDLGTRLAVKGDKSALIDAVLNVDIFKKFFENYKDSALPSDTPAKTFLANAGIPPDRTKACWGQIRENGEQCGLIQKVTGALRVLSRDHAIERMGLKTEPSAEVSELGEEIADEVKGATEIGFPSLNINLEIHLPADAKPEVYEAIFASMRKHLIDGRSVESP